MRLYRLYRLYSLIDYKYMRLVAVHQKGSKLFTEGQIQPDITTCWTIEVFDEIFISLFRSEL